MAAFCDMYMGPAGQLASQASTELGVPCIACFAPVVSAAIAEFEVASLSDLADGLAAWSHYAGITCPPARICHKLKNWCATEVAVGKERFLQAGVLDEYIAPT